MIDYQQSRKRDLEMIRLLDFVARVGLETGDYQAAIQQMRRYYERRVVETLLSEERQALVGAVAGDADAPPARERDRWGGDEG
jgi:hypothetical protein